MEELLVKAMEYGVTPLNIVLAVMLYFLGAQNGTFPKFSKIWGKKETSEDKAPTLHDLHESVRVVQTSMVKLTNHFNDETTDKLTTIARNQDHMKRGIDKISAKQDEIDTHITKIRVRQDNWHEYGIKIRKES